MMINTTKRFFSMHTVQTHADSYNIVQDATTR